MGSNNFDMIPCSHGERSETFIPILPDVIIFEILLLLPGDILYNVMRYVCRNWYKIIEHPLFVSKHLMLSACTLLVPTGVGCFSEYRLSHGLQLLDPKDPGAELTSFKVEFPCTQARQLMSSCNGLLLMDTDVHKELEIIFYVGNPVTHRIMPLPPLPEYMRCRYGIEGRHCCLAFAASSKAYKVLVVYEDLRFRKGRDSYRRGCSILTVGIDKEWRELNLTHLNEDDMKFLIYLPLSSTGIIYWAVHSSSNILAFDVESECIKTIQLPRDYDENNYFLPKGNSITFWQTNRDLSMDVWVLKDHRTGEWVKLLRIESEPVRYVMDSFLLRNMLSPWPEYYIADDSVRQKSNLQSLNSIIVEPITWLEKRETIIFDTRRLYNGSLRSNFVFVYDLKTRTCTEVGLQHFRVRYLTPFINNLAWI